MRLYNITSIYTRAAIIAALALIIYGIICRAAAIYFFWESYSIGWALLMVGGILFLVDARRSKKREKKKAVLEGIAIGMLVFILFIKTLLICIIPNTDAYRTVEKSIYSNWNVETEMGTVTGISVLPSGSIQLSSSGGEESGSASICVIVKGKRKYMELTFYLALYPGSSQWQVESVDQ